MQFTSERIIPDYYFSNFTEYMLYLMHIKSYENLNGIVKGKVLDYGCGMGYGTKIIGNYADVVTGIDLDEQAVEYAQNSNNAGNINYYVLKKNYKKLPFDDSTFDTVISFQVIEHVEDMEQYLSEIKRVLKPKGNFILTTPNARVRLYPYQNPWNHHHITEFNQRELILLIKEYFRINQLKGIHFSPKYQKKEMKRVWVRKSVLYPLSMNIIPEKLRKACLKFMWGLTMGRQTAGKKNVFNNKKYSQHIIIDNEIKHCASFFLIAEKTS